MKETHVEFVKYHNGINSDESIRIIHCDRWNKHKEEYCGCAYWCRKTDNPQAELEAAKERFLAEVVKDLKYSEIKIYNEENDVLFIKAKIKGKNSKPTTALHQGTEEHNV